MTTDAALMAEWLLLAGHAVFDGFDSPADVAKQFEIDEAVAQGIIAAIYDQDGYEGSAFVLLLRDGKLYEVSGSHCSCNGLEGQWSEEETSVPALRKRDWHKDNPRLEQLYQFLESMEAHTK